MPLKNKRISPAQLIPISFLSAIIVGTVFLILPVSTAAGETTDILTALFTATTSVCVTGLVVVDTYAHWSPFGQLVILKYAQVEDKYDPDTTIPTLKLYPNGCLSNTWSFTRDIRERLQAEEAGTRR